MVAPSNVTRGRGIAFLASYLPRKCGIATFTHDLSSAVLRQCDGDQRVTVVAMNDRPEGYDYPERVKFEVRQGHQIDYARAADFLNFSRIDVLSLQHEYGIFGGNWGGNVLGLLRDLNRPVVVTCHTVLANPLPDQKAVFDEILARADRVVVMTRKALEFISDVYHVGEAKAVLIPHGIHDVPFIDPNYYKDKFGVEGRRVLLTFGLLSRNKGIEDMIEALPRIVERHPRVTYVVLGATHPAVVQEEGESYRLELQRRVRDLHLEDHVLFHPRFVELDELLEYIGASDLFVAPYHNMDQITSGALSYAMGAGKAVVATPFWHAEELLAEGRGALVPPHDPEALAREVNALLDDEVALTAMRKRAYIHCRGTVWPAVARSYLGVFDDVRNHVMPRRPRASALRRPISATNVPTPRLDHLARLCDDTGPAHHARYTVPQWRHGYRLEDAAAYVVTCAKFHDVFSLPQAQRLTEVNVALLQTLIGDGTQVHEGLDYGRRPLGPASAVAVGKALWALGYLVQHRSSALAQSAIDSFHDLVGRRGELSDARAAAYGALGAANYLARFPGASEFKRLLGRYVDRVRAVVGEDWVEAWPAADWPLPVQVLSVAAVALQDPDLRKDVDRTLEVLIERTGGGRNFVRERDGEDESPVSAAVFIDAVGAVFQDRRDKALLGPIRAAADWFLGANRLGQSLYDFGTGGCHDALTPAGLNANQGTEASVFCLLSFLTLHQLAALDAEKAGATD
ncbi:MAG: glycosyltransferase family 4 protein [Candidatus Krumholzibacteria bacterium]|nr:glycosyltransferase family 4 protein [Candidatus Krumholzibacteria bacterium]